MVYGLLDNFVTTWHCVLRVGLAVNCLIGPVKEIRPNLKNLIIDTDIFSDVDDAGALLLAATLPNVNLLAVNVNYPSSYSALAVSAILAHYGHANVPVGLRRPFTNATFFDTWHFDAGEFASKVAFHWSGGTLPWGKAEKAWRPVDLYRKVLSEQDDGSVKIVSLGFLENLSALLKSTAADGYSALSGLDLVTTKVSELVIMGGEYPSGREFNFWGDDSTATAYVVKTWPGRITYSGYEMGRKVFSGTSLALHAPDGDPVRAAYRWYLGCNTSRQSWDPLTVLYACEGLGDMFEYANDFGYNFVYPNGSNSWIYDQDTTNQHWLRLKVDNATAGQALDRLFLEGTGSAGL